MPTMIVVFMAGTENPGTGKGFNFLGEASIHLLTVPTCIWLLKGKGYVSYTAHPPVYALLQSAPFALFALHTRVKTSSAFGIAKKPCLSVKK